MEENYYAENLNQIRQALQMLGLPYEEQINLFPQFVPTADELAIIFDDEVTSRKDFLFQNGCFNKKVYDLINELDSILNQMSGPQNEEFWTLNSLKTSEIWDKCRKLSAEILLELNVEDI